MNLKKRITLVMLSVVGLAQAVGQGSFVNLDFEAANPAGYSTGMNVPLSAILPGWQGFYNGMPISVGAYNTVPLGSAAICVLNTNIGSLGPTQGKYYAFLFGGGISSVAISQTGLVPSGTKSLQFDAWWIDSPFIVSLGGLTLQMTALQTFANYTHYSADISAFAGQTATLTFSEPAPRFWPTSEFLLDNIQFSPQPIPEPSVLSLVGLGALLVGWRRWRGAFAWRCCFGAHAEAEQALACAHLG